MELEGTKVSDGGVAKLASLVASGTTQLPEGFRDAVVEVSAIQDADKLASAGDAIVTA